MGVFGGREQRRQCNGMVDEGPKYLACVISYGGGAITHVGVGGAVVERALYGLRRDGKRGLRTDEMRSTGKGTRSMGRSGGLSSSSQSQQIGRDSVAIKKQAGVNELAIACFSEGSRG